MSTTPEPTLYMYGMFTAPGACPLLNSSGVLIHSVQTQNKFKKKKKKKRKVAPEI